MEGLGAIDEAPGWLQRAKSQWTLFSSLGRQKLPRLFPDSWFPGDLPTGRPDLYDASTLPATKFSKVSRRVLMTRTPSRIDAPGLYTRIRSERCTLPEFLPVVVLPRSDTGGIDIEVRISNKNLVVSSTHTGRIYSYKTGTRVFQSTIKPVSCLKSAKRNTAYVGGVLDGVSNTRHGWGVLVAGRVLAEGVWRFDKPAGPFLIYHEFWTALGSCRGPLFEGISIEGSSPFRVSEFEAPSEVASENSVHRSSSLVNRRRLHAVTASSTDDIGRVG